MYRVELKASCFFVVKTPFSRLVPNVPCGVERSNLARARGGVTETVPNVPCGVESNFFEEFFHSTPPVPNVPCGVESFRGGTDLVPFGTECS